MSWWAIEGGWRTSYSTTLHSKPVNEGFDPAVCPYFSVVALAEGGTGLVDDLR